MGNNMNDAVNITINNLSLAFGKTEVLKGLNLEIEPGELFSFLGPSGSGKSTLLQIFRDDLSKNNIPDKQIQFYNLGL